MKLKEFGPGGPRVPHAPLRSAIDLNLALHSNISVATLPLFPPHLYPPSHPPMDHIFFD